ncbi:hypothetical protein FRC17_011095 [Serendipita sp. 399]|nr:hypothetical protein FRC17_011095 [Serendipita sp. 399]
MPPPPSSTKALNAILPLIASGQPYEAHQKARTFASRYSKSGAYDVAIDVLYQSATELFKGGHLGSGTDLSQFLIEVYELKDEKVTEESRGLFSFFPDVEVARSQLEPTARLTQLISLAGAKGTWRKTLIDRSIAWSAKYGQYATGDPGLHGFIGDLFYKEQYFIGAEPHLLASGSRDSAKTLANMLFAWSRNGAEPSIYASKGVIPYLLSGNILAARSFLSQFLSLLISARPSVLATPNPVVLTASGSETTSPDELFLTTEPVLNFLQLVIRTCQRAKNAGAQAKQAQEAW